MQQYFRAMMWLGRIDFRIIETLPDLRQVFRRRHLEGALAIQSLIDADAKARWTRIDRAIGAFIGEHDSMDHPRRRALLDRPRRFERGRARRPVRRRARDGHRPPGATGCSGFSSHYMVNGLSSGTMPLNQSFLLMGQRYTLDSHVFSNLVYDRVQDGRGGSNDARPARRSVRGARQRSGGATSATAARDLRLRPRPARDALHGRSSRGGVLGVQPLQPVDVGASRAVARPRRDRRPGRARTTRSRGHRSIRPANSQCADGILGRASPRHSAVHQAVVYRRRRVRVPGRLRRPLSALLRGPRTVCPTGRGDRRFVRLGGRRRQTSRRGGFLRQPLQRVDDAFRKWPSSNVRVGRSRTPT